MRAKICGITREEDALLAAELGAWAVGFIFYAQSPRAVTAAAAAEIVRTLGHSVHKVGVFVDASEEEVFKTVDQTGIDTVQLHGQESPQFCAGLKKRLPEIGLFKS